MAAELPDDPAKDLASSDELTAVMRIGPDPPIVALGGLDMATREFRAMGDNTVHPIDIVRQWHDKPLTETYMHERTPYGQAVLL